MTEEQSWIESARRGDAAAWEKLVLAHQQAIFRLAYLLLGDADNAEDIAQETFLRAHRSLGSFDSARPLRPWLLRIATNLCHNWRRSLGRYVAALQQALRNAPQPVSASELAEAGLQAQSLWQIIRSLSPIDQQIIYLRYFLECTEAETSTALGIAPGTVKSRTHRALARLRAALPAEQDEMIKEGADAHS